MNCKLLLLDNTTAIANPWKKILNTNFNTAEAVGGFEAVTKLKHEEFDIIIVNISLQHMNGADAIRKIREEFYLIPIIALYKQSDVLNLKQVKTYGIQQSLQLPVNIKHLLVTISKLVPPQRLQEASQARQQQQQSAANHRTRDDDYINVEEKFYEGLSAIATSRYDHAIEIYNFILGLTNIKHEAWLRYVKEAQFQLGHCYARLRNYRASNKHFARFISKAPRHNFVREALLHIGQNHESMQNFNKAADYYRKVLEIRPMDSYTTRARKLLEKLEKKGL